ncbi:hypothetical protein B5F10_02075 [Anaerotruncus colihominis]|uniref:Uncharacterized protein n=1 Tax=Anaerotruncus colihominis TaxID=169435 RepID=A0A1Y4MR44_9FIRM|nr:hypothetical protein B5F11_04545 [Anaerotruncus colihominis]OUP75944.1 hypothetical protein B5F10_02075 [Anaerotruncus colihominis]
MVNLKYLWLIVVRSIRNLLHKLPTIISYFFLAFSVISCLIILFPSCFNKVPVLSYYISKQEFPTTYTLNGGIRVLDEDGNIINKNIEVFVGGYSTFLESEHFNLTFSAPTTDEVYVVIRYEANGNMHEFTKCLEIENNNHSITKEFIIYA